MPMSMGKKRKKEPRFPPGSRWYIGYEYSLLVLGTFVVAASFNLLLEPNAIASGGVAGVSILMQELAGVTPAFTQWGLNIPLFAIGAWLLGRRFGIKTAVGTALMPLFVLLTSDWEHRRIMLSSTMASSSARTDFSRPTSRCSTMVG